MLVQARSWRQRERGRQSASITRRRSRGEAGHEHLGRRRLVTERRVRPHRIVMLPPALDDDLGLSQRVEDLAVEQLGIMEEVHHLGG